MFVQVQVKLDSSKSVHSHEMFELKWTQSAALEAILDEWFLLMLCLASEDVN